MMAQVTQAIYYHAAPIDYLSTVFKSWKKPFGFKDRVGDGALKRKNLVGRALLPACLFLFLNRLMKPGGWGVKAVREGMAALNCLLRRVPGVFLLPLTCLSTPLSVPVLLFLQSDQGPDHRVCTQIATDRLVCLYCLWNRGVGHFCRLTWGFELEHPIG